jgi:hypothetical protein
MTIVIVVVVTKELNKGLMQVLREGYKDGSSTY